MMPCVIPWPKAGRDIRITTNTGTKTRFELLKLVTGIFSTLSARPGTLWQKLLEYEPLVTRLKIRISPVFCVLNL